MLELDARTVLSPESEPRVELRPLAPVDWPAVEDIYWNGIRSGLATFEVESPSWEAWDAAHVAEPRLVAEEDGLVVGFAALAPVSTRYVYRGVAEASVYVRDGWRGRGIGRRLLGRLVAASERAGFWTIQASVFPENRASLGLFTRCGFRVVGVRERIGRRDGLWRDTVLLERRSEVVA